MVVLLTCGILFIRYLMFAQAQNVVPRFESAPCDFAPPDGYEPECGHLIVPEDRTNPASPTIQLGVAIYRSTSPTRKPDPIVYLIGGPGGSALENQSVSFNERYRPFVDSRDYIIFDQRGAQHSTPSLDCDGLVPQYYDWAAQGMNNEELANAQAEALLACEQDLLNAGINVAAYQSAENAADVADLRLALGYDEWNLFGVSYGARLALTVMRDHPEGVRSVVLDSVYAPQVDLFMEYGTNTAAAFEHLFASCAADEACAAAYPTLRDDFYFIVQTLNNEPLLITATHPISHMDFSVYVTGEMMVEAVFGMMYRRDDIPYIPYLIDDTMNYGEELLTIAAENFVDTPFAVSEGLYYSVSCSEETPFTDWDTAYANLEAMPEAIRVTTYLPFIRQVCDGWTIHQPDAIENEPVVSDIPTLVLNGDFDPITPPRWAEQTASTLSSAHFYLFPGTGHGVVRSTDCGANIMQAFLDDPQSPPDTSCIDNLGEPEWVLP
ncbi:MAG: alpha/beta hydrolase [Anaerolineae bacterium]